MEGVTFDGLHSYTDFDLILNSVAISPAEPKTYYVEIPGADGKIDITDSMGDVRYKNRTISIGFTYKGTHGEQLNAYSRLGNAVHGQRMDVSIDADSNYHYEGRVSIKKCEHMPYACTFDVECDVEPYKYHAADEWLWDPFDFENDYVNEISNKQVDGTLELMVIGGKKNTVPWISCSNDMNLTYDGVLYNLKSGRNRILAVKIKEGENYFVFEGNGVVSLEFKGGDL
jgi:hypothetical protein